MGFVNYLVFIQQQIFVSWLLVICCFYILAQDCGSLRKMMKLTTKQNMNCLQTTCLSFQGNILLQPLKKAQVRYYSFSDVEQIYQFS